MITEEQEILEDRILFLERQLLERQTCIDYRMNQLRKLKQIDEMQSVFGTITLEEQNIKQEIYEGINI